MQQICNFLKLQAYISQEPPSMHLLNQCIKRDNSTNRTVQSLLKLI